MLLNYIGHFFESKKYSNLSILDSLVLDQKLIRGKFPKISCMCEVGIGVWRLYGYDFKKSTNNF